MMQEKITALYLSGILLIRMKEEGVKCTGFCPE